jgi:hypothetical protein
MRFKSFLFEWSTEFKLANSENIAQVSYLSSLVLWLIFNHCIVLHHIYLNFCCFVVGICLVEMLLTSSCAVSVIRTLAGITSVFKAFFYNRIVKNLLVVTVSYFLLLHFMEWTSWSAGKKCKINTNNSLRCVIPCFPHDIDESCNLLGYYAASSGNFLMTCWENLSFPSSGFKNPKESL